jgi:hypothetical protein
MSEHTTGPYERLVQSITEFVKPHLHKVTHDFVEKSIDTYAPDNPRFAKIIAFEVRRRGDGAGLTQDVSEPLLWAGIKTGAALTIAWLTHRLQNKQFRLIGDVTALSIMLNNSVELFRLVPRYKAGLQGSLEMAKDRWDSIEATGVDPFRSQTRELNTTASPPEAPEHVLPPNTDIYPDPYNMGWQAKVIADKVEQAHLPFLRK